MTTWARPRTDACQQWHGFIGTRGRWYKAIRCVNVTPGHRCLRQAGKPLQTREKTSESVEKR